ncbi:ABC transporter ATP-binding protein [Anaerorhabdus furcosa]|uniref:ABC-2 type transport system ATP-binding protein n=1 Tax=Anaerorhabdus furcosa TaxID=118967 RepID=A0A1T4NYZ5_9FIRM|nr:ABC transporter ATP-binding protein [Anaerorhabdus furcosa]SJZ84431.1 ABC-2 type transport system ATP-binding protein [Anaerorhabdus furcosa]
MKNITVIKIENLFKSFVNYYDKPMMLKERILRMKKGEKKVVEILKNISLEISKGEITAIIGSNGSGKSTLLKILTNIIYPTSGTIDIQGKVAGILELGAGFHPDFTGRENIYINASIWGLSKKDIDSILNEIIDFSELKDYIDAPVRVYSSGMYIRLAFAIAINVKADILLIDEVFAVGDANFQKKCLTKLRELKNKGVTIILVTHDSGIVKEFCSRAIWISDGSIKLDGNAVDVSMKYDESVKFSS